MRIKRYSFILKHFKVVKIDKEMKIVFLIRGNNHPASRYRVLQYIPFFKQSGIDTGVEIFPDKVFAWFKLINRIKDADVVLIQKKKINNFWLKRIKRNGAKIVYDVDDAIMFNSSRHDSPDSPLRMRRFIKMVQNCDAVIAGNSYLKSLIEKYNSRIRVLSLSMDMEKYKVKAYQTDEELTKPSNCSGSKVVVGWIGGTKSLFFVEKLMPMFEALAVKHPDIVLKIVCDKFPESSKILIEKKMWCEEEEGADVMSFDIGISILTDDPWSKGKCGTKLLQCMAAGVPSIASPVGVHTEIIKDGVNGYLATSDEEWSAKLSILFNDPVLRKKIGLAGRKTVEDDFSLNGKAAEMIEILKSV